MMDRNTTEGPVSNRGVWHREEHSPREIEASCKDIADYLLDLSRGGNLESALGVLVDALDDGIQQLEGEARIRAEHVYLLLHRSHISSVERKRTRSGSDPYFWG